MSPKCASKSRYEISGDPLALMYCHCEECRRATGSSLNTSIFVRREDFPLVESVQKGLRSRGYAQGRFIVDAERSYISEHAVHDLQLKVLRALGEID